MYVVSISCVLVCLCWSGVRAYLLLLWRKLQPGLCSPSLWDDVSTSDHSSARSSIFSTAQSLSLVDTRAVIVRRRECSLNPVKKKLAKDVWDLAQCVKKGASTKDHIDTESTTPKQIVYNSQCYASMSPTSANLNLQWLITMWLENDMYNSLWCNKVSIF